MTAPSKKTNSHLFRNRFLIVLLFILGATIVFGFMSFQNIYLKRDFLNQHNINSTEIDLIGFHGHTILHTPLYGKTWQIGDGKRLAKELLIDVIADFRDADIAGGGEGAPLAPVFHKALAQNLDTPLCILNIGGVANLTWISREAMVAFDTP